MKNYKTHIVPLVTFIVCFIGPWFTTQHALAFDHTHEEWNRLLKKHVVVITNGSATQVRYAGFKKDRTTLKRYLDSLSSVKKSEFDPWSKNKQLAFLINAYNAFTIELILTRYPDLDSIWDTGSFLVKPWRKRFFMLLDQKRHLDDIEHNMIREKGVYDEFRIHFAVNCASIGCPALRNEAFTYSLLDTQLEDSMVRFLSDTSRNRYNPKSNTLEVSKIFDWYETDFTGGKDTLKSFFSTYAHLFSSQADHVKFIREMNVSITFLKYDWGLNDVKSTGKK